MRYVRDTIINAADGSVDETSVLIDSNQLLSASFQVISTGTVAGVVQVQVSNDAPSMTSAPPTNWSDLSGAAVTISTSGVLLIPKIDLCYRFIQVTFTNTSGTGLLSVEMMALSI